MWHEIKRGPKYGINTVKPEQLKYLTITEGEVEKGSPYEAVSYYLLEKVLSTFRKFSKATALVDLGCGKGRVMVVSVFFGFVTVTGIDFAKELCVEAKKNMARIEPLFKKIEWDVICKDVLNYEIRNTDSVFFMFNPFEKEILEKFLQKIDISLKKAPRTIWFLYASPVHLKTILNYNFKIIQHIHPGKKLNAVIMKKDNQSLLQVI